MRFCSIQLRSISQCVPKLLFCTMSLKTILLKTLPHLPGANELKQCMRLVWPYFSLLTIKANRIYGVDIWLSFHFPNYMSVWGIPACSLEVMTLWHSISYQDEARQVYSQCCEHRNNTLRPRQNGRHFPDDIFTCIFLNENAWILINILLKFVPKGQFNNIPALVQIMAWCRPGDKPLSEPMMVSLRTYICFTRPQWDNWT